MHQKVDENTVGNPGGGGSVGALGTPFDSTTITQALEDFIAAVTPILHNDFKDLPGQIEQAVKSVADSFSDPKTLLSTALSDLMTAFQDLADDFVKFAQDIAPSHPEPDRRPARAGRQLAHRAGQHPVRLGSLPCPDRRRAQRA